jgi:hypothetical protein
MFIALAHISYFLIFARVSPNNPRRNPNNRSLHPVALPLTTKRLPLPLPRSLVLVKMAVSTCLKLQLRPARVVAAVAVEVSL